jgi:hypothetical protein
LSTRQYSPLEEDEEVGGSVEVEVEGGSVEEEGGKVVGG